MRLYLIAVKKPVDGDYRTYYNIKKILNKSTSFLVLKKIMKLHVRIKFPRDGGNE
jgi:hypothetical protein